MSPIPIPSEPMPAGHNATSPELADAYARVRRAADGGERHSWKLPEDPGAEPTTAKVATWLRQVLTVPWGLDAASVDAVCGQLDQILARDERPGLIEVLRDTAADHRRPTVYLAVSARRGGELQPPLIARVDAVVGRAS